MAFGYSFVTLTPEQKEARRLTLDFYSYVGAFSPLIALFVIQIYTHLTERARTASRGPYSAVSGGSVGNNLQARLWRQLRWWAADNLLPSRPQYGTKGDWVLALTWTSWLVWLCTVQTGNDYFHLTKRFGIIGASQLPLLFSLGLRSPWSPVGLLLHRSHEELKVLHQMLARILVGFFSVHGILYMNYYIQSSKLLEKLGDTVVIFGLVSLAVFWLLTGSSLAVVKKWNYRAFYITHIILSLAVIELLIFHVSHIIKYTLATIFLYAVLQIQRNRQVVTYTGTISLISGTNLVAVKIPLAFAEEMRKWRPGMHVYLNRPTVSPSLGMTLTNAGNRYSVNPFTIASLPAKDKKLMLVARALDGNTKHLAKVARKIAQQTEAGDPMPTIPLTIEGPYGAASRLPDLTLFDRVLFVAGGVGATFIMPVYRAMIEAAAVDDRTEEVLSKTKVVWSVRNTNETAWALPDAAKNDAALSKVEVYVTRAHESASKGIHFDDDDDNGDIELAEGEGLLTDGTDDEKPPNGVNSREGRPNLPGIIDDTFGNERVRVAVLVCGPEKMDNELRHLVGSYVWRGRDVFWHAEAFRI